MAQFADLLASVLARVVVDVLAYLHARQDLKRRVLAELQAKGDQWSMAAYRFLAEAADRPDAGADLRVQPGAPPVPREPPGADDDASDLLPGPK